MSHEKPTTLAIISRPTINSTAPTINIAVGNASGGLLVACAPNDTPPTTTAASETVTISTAFGKAPLVTHIVATLVMITSVATCMTPVMPAV